MQQKKNLLGICSIILLFTVFAGISSCKKKFDEPPAAADQPLPAGYTKISVKDLKARHTSEGVFDPITDKVAIEVVVTANDKSGNLYKQIFVQDETGAIEVLLDQAGLYGPYPVGRKLWIKCDGLDLSDDGGVPVIGVKFVLNGVPQMAGVEPQRIREHIVGGSLNNPVVPKVVTVAELGFDLQDENIGRLIQIQGYQFNYPNTTYSDTSNYRKTVNMGVKNCAGDTIIVRNSAYASFAGYPLPQGNGNLTAIYTVYTPTSRPAKQLLIRDTADVQFYDYRCGQGPTTLLPTADLRALYTGTTTHVESGKRITGVVISDRSTGNINARNIVLQQGNGLAGVLVRFAANHSFNLGDTIDVNVSGAELSEFNGLLQVNNVALEFATLIGTGKSITPREATVADINTNVEAWESTLIKVKTATLSPAGAWSASSGNTTVTQGGSTIVIYTLAAATFSGVTKPTGNVDVVAILSQFKTTNQLTLRSADDVTGGGGGGGGTGATVFSEDFNSYASSTTVPFAATGWHNVSTPDETATKYFPTTAAGASFIKVSAFKSTQVATAAITSWLISPAISLAGTTAPKLSFTTAARYTTGTFKILISTDYNSANPPSAATWTDVTSSATLAALPSSAFTPWVPSGNIDLTTYAGQTIYIAYRYDVPAGTAANDIATFEVDDIKIKD